MNTTSDAAALDSAIRISRRRLMPCLILMYVLAFIDRSNVGFAKAALLVDAGISDAVFAFGASIFFIGYACFEVPSNYMLHKLGARIWLSRIMVTWGLVSAAMMFTHDATTFYLLRFLLGVAEAGFFPGIILYLTYWFPARERGQALGLFYFGLPLALVLGSPLSGWLLEMHGVFGLKNWQCLFLVEGTMASVVGVFAYFYLVDRPRNAPWLSRVERDALEDAIERENAQRQMHSPHGFMKALANKQVLKFCLVYLTIQMSVYGVVFYLPTRIAALMGRGVGLDVGMVIAIPWLCALVVTRLVTLNADRSGRHQHLAGVMLALAALGIATSVLSQNIVLVILAFCVAASGFVAVQPLFWTLPTNYLSGGAAAGGIALINSMGNLGGFAAPNLKVIAEKTFHSQSAGMFSLAIVALLGVAMLWRLGRTMASPPAPKLDGISA